MPRGAGRQGRHEALAARLRPRFRLVRPHPAGPGPARRSHQARRKPDAAASRRGSCPTAAARGSWRATTPTTSILDWIRAGAAGPKETDAQLERIEVFPPAALLKPKDTLRVIVRAFYSDGIGRGRDPLGPVQVQRGSRRRRERGRPRHRRRPRRGGDHRPLRDQGRDAHRSRRRSPNAVDAAVFAKSPRQQLHRRTRPEEAANSCTFRRPARAPTPSSSAGPSSTPAAFCRRRRRRRSFSPTPTRRNAAKLIDRLLERPEFVDYWAYKWSDLLLVSSRKLPQPAMWAFYRKVRQSVADNEPWDRFARDILTATGSTLDERRRQLLRAAQGRERTDRGDRGHVPGHVDRLREVPQPPAGEMDAGSILGLRQPVQPRRPEERRRGRARCWCNRASKAMPCTCAGASPMPPTPLDGKPLPLDSPIDRRDYFADWLTAPDNPYFAKALVNRVWRNFMGRGLVEAEDDLRVSNPPSNPELLDALAEDFVKQQVRREAPDADDPELRPRISAPRSRCRRTPRTIASTRTTSSAACRPR